MKNDILEHRKAVQQNIMKSFGVKFPNDSLEKGMNDEINPFEMEAYKSGLTKAELDEFEKAKHQDGDMHPNGKWVWRQSANGGKGDWRSANSKRGGGGSSKITSSSGEDSNNQKSSEKTNENFSKEKIDSLGDGSVIKITNAQTGNPVITITKKGDNWYAKTTMTRSEVRVTSEQVLNYVKQYNKKTYSTKIDSVKNETDKSSDSSKTTSQTSSGDLKKFISENSYEYADWLRNGEYADSYEEKNKESFKQLKKMGWKLSNKFFDGRDIDEAEEYVDKMERKGYEVIGIDDGSDTYTYLIRKK